MKKIENIFDLLDEKVAELAKKRFKKPTPIQEATIPEVLKGRNCLIIASTGMGKTESAMLGLFSKIKNEKPISLLYITPMKSLNRDMFERLIWWANKLDISISIRHGDTTPYERKMQSQHPDHILITTPETLQAILTGSNMRKHLSNVKYVIVDELHELVESKRGAQLTLGLERLRMLCGNFQLISISATIGSPEDTAKFIGCDKIIKVDSDKQMKISVESTVCGTTEKSVAEKLFISPEVAARLLRIYDLMKSYRSVLVFTNTRESAEVLSSRLRLYDNAFPHDIHHSSLSKDARIKAENDFKTEKLKSLIATSSLELGIDIGSIDLVIQYMSPRQVSKFTQRTGRSGHGIGRISESIIITGEDDDIFESAVIARKTLAGELEEVMMHKKPLDVLAHQIVGLCMSEYGIDSKKIKEIVKKAEPFSKLTEREFQKLLNFLSELKLIWIDKNQIKRRRKAFDYYFSNLSTIPDSYQYKVIDIATNQAVGSIDEQFIATHEDGTNFIVKGRAWKIVSVDGNKIYVDAINDITSTIPSWEGELIPIPFSIANEVLELRKFIEENLHNERLSEEIMSKYPVNAEACRKMIELIRRHAKKYKVPDNFTIESGFIETPQGSEEYVVMHSCLGTKVNETFSRFVSTVLSAKYGSAIATRVDPYRIIFKGCKAEDVKNVFETYKPEDIQPLLEKSLLRTSLFKWKFIAVAKRFGAITRNAKFDKVKIDRIIDTYWNTPIFDETLRELFFEKLDIEKSMKLYPKKISIIKGFSTLAEIGFRYEFQDIAKPSRPEAEIFRIFKKRILNTKLRLICVNCGKYSITKNVKDIDELRCPKCSSKLIAIVNPYQSEAQDLIKKNLKGSSLTKEEKKKLERIKWTAELALNSGRNAAICLAGRGIGPDTATRLLAKPYKTEDDLFKLVLEAEKNFIKTKRFWS